MQASYEASGTENLRADPSVKAGGENASPSGAGEDTGGKDNPKANFQVKTAPTKATSTYAKDSRPAGVQSFRDMAKE